MNCKIQSLERAIAQFQEPKSKLRLDDRSILKIVLTKVDEEHATDLDGTSIKISYRGVWATNQQKIVHGSLISKEKNIVTNMYVYKHDDLPGDFWLNWYKTQLYGSDASQSSLKKVKISAEASFF